MTDDERVYERRWWTLGILCLSLVMIIVGNTVLNVALPTLIREIDASSTDLQWMVDAYALVFAGLLLTGGALGDRFGRKGALTIGLVIFGAGVAAGRHLRLGQPGHRHPGDHGRGRGAGDAGHPVDPRHRLPAAGAGPGHRRVGRPGRRRRRHRAHRRRLAARALLVGLGVPGQHPGDRHRPGGRALPRPHVPRPRKLPLDPVGAGLSIVGLGSVLYAIIEAPTHGWTGRPHPRRRRHRPRLPACCSRPGSCARPTPCSTCGSSGTPGSARPRPPSCWCSSPSSARSSCSPSTCSWCGATPPSRPGCTPCPRPSPSWSWPP